MSARAAKLLQRIVSMKPSQSRTNGRGWGFHTVPVVVDPGDHCFRPQVIDVEDVRRNLTRGRDCIIAM